MIFFRTNGASRVVIKLYLIGVDLPVLAFDGGLLVIEEWYLIGLVF